MIKGLTSDEERDVILSVGTHQRERRLSPTEVAELFAKALAGGATRTELADACQLTGGTWIGRFLRLNSLPADVRHIIGWGADGSSLSMTQAQEIARLRSDDGKRLLALKALEHRLSSTEVREIVQVIDRSGATVDAAVQAQLKLRPRVQYKYVFVGLIGKPSLSKHLESLTQGERDQLIREYLTSKKLKVQGHMSPTQFVLIGDEPEVKVDEEERNLNQWLAKKLG
jgi:hypothetical protein